MSVGLRGMSRVVRAKRHRIRALAMRVDSCGSLVEGTSNVEASGQYGHSSILSPSCPCFFVSPSSLSISAYAMLISLHLEHTHSKHATAA